MKIKCRCCGSNQLTTFTDLGLAPLSNDFIREEDITKGQYTLPLKILVCEECKLVQTLDFEAPENIFNSEYKYFSSFSKSWLKHCEKYVDMIVQRRNLTSDSTVVEIASNDGYLLQYFKKHHISPVGVEPSAGCAEEAIKKGIETRIAFWGREYADSFVEKEGKADLIIGNNVLAHVPEINDFVSGVKAALKVSGIVTFEFPHLLNLMQYNQFDTIYHEHFSYLSALTVKRVLENNGLKITKIEKLETHGGSIRVYGALLESEEPIDDSVEAIIKEEIAFGLNDMEIYKQFFKSVIRVKYNVLKKLIEIKENKKSIVGYGAAAKGNTLFNYCGIGKEFIDYVVDASPHKQGLYLPGTLIPVKHPDEISVTKPDYVIIIPWNIKEEIKEELKFIKEWGGKFIVLIPEIEEL